jgi:integrase
MSVRRRKDGRLFVDFYDPSGRRIREVVETRDRREAQEYHDRIKAELWKAQRLGHKPRVPFATAAARWLREAQKASIRNDMLHIKFWRGHFTYLDEITREKADLAVAHLGNGNANRYLATLRSILKKAEGEWNMIEKAPGLRFRQEARRRVRFLTQSEADTLCSSLPAQHRPLIRLLLSTGLRLGSALKLAWTQVDLTRRVAWIHGDQSKSGKPIPVPLNDDAVAALLEAQGRHPVKVFNQTRPTNRIWKKALVKAGIEDFRFHDCRHTWASWHVQAGTPLYALQELGGWQSVEMVRRYAHLAPEHLAEHAARIERLGTTKAQPSDSSDASDSTTTAKSLIQKAGGEGEIRTHVGILSAPSDFESGTGRSAITH